MRAYRRQGRRRYCCQFASDSADLLTTLRWRAKEKTFWVSKVAQGWLETCQKCIIHLNKICTVNQFPQMYRNWMNSLGVQPRVNYLYSGSTSTSLSHLFSFSLLLAITRMSCVNFLYSGTTFFNFTFTFHHLDA